MSKADYSAETIIKNAWPEWTPAEGGGRARHWAFEFERPPSEQPERLMLSEDLSDGELAVYVGRGAAPSELRVITTTQENAWSDAIFFTAFYRLFERMESKFGRLKAIQGQSRDQWRPFR